MEPSIVGKEPRGPAHRFRETPSTPAASSSPRGSTRFAAKTTVGAPPKLLTDSIRADRGSKALPKVSVLRPPSATRNPRRRRCRCSPSRFIRPLRVPAWHRQPEHARIPLVCARKSGQSPREGLPDIPPRVLPCPLAPGSSALFYRPPTRANLFRSQHIVLAESITYVFDPAAASYTVDREGIALVFIRNCFVVGQPHRPVSDPRPLAPGYR